ncbi:MAG: hypothetical protein ABF811_00350 [Pseudoclavibacter sp.]
MDPAPPPPPVDVAAVCAITVIRPQRVSAQLQPAMLTIWVDDRLDEPLLVIDCAETPVLRLTAESARRFSRALANLLTRWRPSPGGP